MKSFLLLLILIFCFSTAFAQNKDAGQPGCSIKDYTDKSYIFLESISIAQVKQKTDGTFSQVGDDPILAPAKSIFKVVNVTSDCKLVIEFDGIFKADDKKAQLNYIEVSPKDKNGNPVIKDGNPVIKSKQELNLNSNIKQFVLAKNDFDRSCTEYIRPDYITLSFGTFMTPFKFRPSKSLFTSKLSLGTEVLLNHSIKKDMAIGLVVGLSVSQVTLDSLSIRNSADPAQKFTTPTDRPAITPSVSFVYSYKGVNVALGFGIDYINKTSAVEKRWIFNGKPWLGFGIGINLFTPNAQPVTQKTEDQK